LLADGNKIVFRYFNKNCLSCYGEIISTFTKFIDVNNSNRFIVLSDIYNSINIKYFIRNTKIDCPVFSNRTLNLHIPCEELEMPYCFVLDSNLNVSMSFILRQKNIELFKEYLEIALNKINSNE